MEQSIFKVGDVVYHWSYGKGKVTEIRIFHDTTYPIIVDFNGVIRAFTVEGAYNDGPVLSFTPYDLINGGFSQVRPMPDIKQGQLIYVLLNGEWKMRYFSHWLLKNNGVKLACYFEDQKRKEGPIKQTEACTEYSITNPLESFVDIIQVLKDGCDNISDDQSSEVEYERYFALKKEFQHPYRTYLVGTNYSPSMWADKLGHSMSENEFIKLVETDKRFMEYFKETTEIISKDGCSGMSCWGK